MSLMFCPCHTQRTSEPTCASVGQSLGLDAWTIIRSHLLVRQPAAEHRGLPVKALSEGGDLRALSASRRADVMPALAQKIARLPKRLVRDAWDAALRQDGQDREALLADVCPFGPALRRCLPAPAVSALDAAIAASAMARWLA